MLNLLPKKSDTPKLKNSSKIIFILGRYFFKLSIIIMQQKERIIVSIIPERVSSELKIINDFSFDEFMHGTAL